jgi:prepilin-type N-terminal cleavage/methylation domain-containing protein
MKSIYLKTKRGFTLIEIMVATSIFMIIMLMAMGALVTTSDTAKKSQALRTAMDNVSFAMESMTRTLRMGQDYLCVNSGAGVSLPLSTLTTADCDLSSSGGGAIVFKPAQHTSQDTAFMISGSTLQRCSPGCVDITSPEVSIEDLRFYVRGSDLDDSIQPSIYITIKGVVTIKGEDSTFAIQTSVSQRSGE